MSREARLALPPAPASAATARRFVGDTLGGWGCDDFVDAAQLLVSELVTNAVLHARTDVAVALSVAGSGVRIEVTDRSHSAPVVRRYDDDAMTGRGLALVDEMASAWGVEPAADGKTVWFELGTAPPRRARR